MLSDLVAFRVELLLVEKRDKVEGECLLQILKSVEWLCMSI
jgi:hypothetical protein